MPCFMLAPSPQPWGAQLCLPRAVWPLHALVSESAGPEPVAPGRGATGPSPPPAVWGDGHSLQSYHGYFTEKPFSPCPRGPRRGVRFQRMGTYCPAGQVPHFSSPRRAPQIRPKDCVERPPLCPSSETGCCWWWAADEVSSAARLGGRG